MRWGAFFGPSRSVAAARQRAAVAAREVTGGGRWRGGGWPPELPRGGRSGERGDRVLTRPHRPSGPKKFWKPNILVFSYFVLVSTITKLSSKGEDNKNICRF